METIKYISIEVLAAQLSLPQKYLRELSRQGKIPGLNVNGRLRYNPQLVQKALDNLAIGGTNEQ